jgi:hypothetical protein
MSRTQTQCDFCPECGSDRVQVVGEVGRSHDVPGGVLGFLFLGPFLSVLLGLFDATPARLQVACLACGKAFVLPRARRKPFLNATFILLVVGLVVAVLLPICAMKPGHPEGPPVPRAPAGPARPGVRSGVPPPAATDEALRRGLLHVSSPPAPHQPTTSGEGSRQGYPTSQHAPSHTSRVPSAVGRPCWTRHPPIPWSHTGIVVMLRPAMV